MKKEKEKVIQIMPWGKNIVMLSNFGRIAKLMEVKDTQGITIGHEWRLLKEIDFENLRR